jgi:dihydrofolate synthase/folylpolyglutamate synthase
MSYSEAVHYLYNLQKYGIKFGLDNITRLMSELGNPHESFRSIHVSGTNGKGSTSATIASILKTAGLRVGLFTSPHLVSFTERIRVDGEEITEGEVAGLAEEVKMIASDIEDFSPTFFEVVTTMAMLYFKRKKVDAAVIEVGMGGRLDATNIVTPDVSVITNISYDHREFLGETLAEIANEKSGIIKKGVPVVTSQQNQEALEVIERAASGKEAEIFVYGKDFFSILKNESESGIYFDFNSFSRHNKDTIFSLKDLFLPLAGEHQMQNASVAIKAASIFLNNTVKPKNAEMENGRNGGLFSPVLRFTGSPVQDEHIIRDGLVSVKWPGRLEFIHEDPPILIDGAHNPAAAIALSKALEKNFIGKHKRIILILGIMGDKDIPGIMKPLLPLASGIILTAPAYKRAASPEKLKEIAASLGFFETQIAPTVREAIESAIKEAKINSSLIVATGSFYTIGEAKEAVGVKGILKIGRASCRERVS